jgi:hypothetical protein
MHPALGNELRLNRASLYHVPAFYPGDSIKSIALSSLLIVFSLPSKFKKSRTSLTFPLRKIYKTLPTKQFFDKI